MKGYDVIVTLAGRSFRIFYFATGAQDALCKAESDYADIGATVDAVVPHSMIEVV